MTLSEFLSQKNIEKENPFEGCDILDKLTYSDYVIMNKKIIAGLFDESDGSYRPLSRETIMRLAIISTILNLDDVDQNVNIDDLFNILICSGLYERFYVEVALKIVPNMEKVIEGINHFVDYQIELSLKNSSSEAQMINMLVGLLESESFMKFLEQIPIEESGVVTEADG